MAITPKQNWRYPTDRWLALADKMDRLGTDRSTYLSAMADLALAETDRETAERLELDGWLRAREAAS